MNLFLFTETFPYGNTEDTFIPEELEALCKEFKVSIIASASREDRNGCYSVESLVEKGITVCNYERKHLGIRLFFKTGCFFICSKIGRGEIWRIIASKTKVFTRLKKSFFFLRETLAFVEWMECHEMIPMNDKELILYSYWYDYHVLALILIKQKCSLENAKIITRTHGCDLYDERIMEGNRQPFKEIMDSYISKVIFASEYGYKYYFKRYGCTADNSKYHIARIGALEPIQSKVCKKKKKYYRIVSCSSISAIKRIDFIVDALKQISDLYLEWIHFGTGEDEANIHCYAEKELSGKTNISYTFMGFVTREFLYHFYSEEQVDCFITTSSTEGGCPVSIQEAMAFGIPIIATSVGGITEMLQDIGGLLPANPVPQDIANEITRILRLDKEQKRTLSEKIVCLWNKKFNSKTNAQKFTEYLLEMCRLE